MDKLSNTSWRRCWKSPTPQKGGVGTECSTSCQLVAQEPCARGAARHPRAALRVGARTARGVAQLRVGSRRLREVTCGRARAVREVAGCAGAWRSPRVGWRSAAFWSSAATRRPRRPAHCRRGRCSPRSSSLTGWRRAHFHCRRPEAPLRCCGQPLRNYARRVARNDGSLEGACLGAPFRPRAARAACSLSPARTPPPTHVLCS